MVAKLEPEELINFGEKVVNYALRLGADEVETFLSWARNVSVEIERAQIVRNIMKENQGFHLEGY